MAGSPYASALGRLHARRSEFLAREFYPGLVEAKDLPELTKLLEATPYGPDLLQFAASYTGAPLLELAVNRTFVRRNRLAYEATPYAGRLLVSAYLRRWDIQNIGLVLAAKADGRPVGEAETFLVSSRDIPAGLFAGTLSLDDFRQLLALPGVDAVATHLVKAGYGATLLPLVEEFSRSHDIFPLIVALDREYYRNLLESARFFQGDEWNVRRFVQSEIDLRNTLLLFKGKDAGLSIEAVDARFIDGGEFSRAQAADAYQAAGVAELSGALERRWPGLPEGYAVYREGRSLAGFESTLLRDRAVVEFRRMRAYPLSVSVIFAYLLMAELERTDLRRVIYGKLYGVSPAALTASLVGPRL